MIGIVLQARAGSTRLPGKVLRVMAGRTMLGHHLVRLRQAKKADKLIVAIPDGEDNDYLARHCRIEGVDCFRGSEDDVLARYFACAQHFHLDHIVRATADCPLVDPDELDALIVFHLREGADYSSSKNEVGCTLPNGTGGEIFSFDALARAHREGHEAHHREHINEYVLEHPELFKIAAYREPAAKTAPQIELTVDTQEDFAFVEGIIAHFEGDHQLMTTEAIIGYLQGALLAPMRCLIYTYGSHERGMGHVYQSYALACALREVAGAQLTFLVPDFPEGLDKFRQWGLEPIPVPRQLLDEEKSSFIEAKIADKEIDALIVDILESSQALMAYFHSKTNCLVSIDDIGDGRVYADLLFNVIHHPPKVPGASYLEINDLRYVILRQDFARAHQREKGIPEQVGRILVTQGGSDTFGGIIKIAKALVGLPSEIEILLLTGSAFGHRAELEETLGELPRPFTVLRDVEDMAGLMLGCDLAITGVGKTVFELAAVGVPFIMITEEPRELETAEIMVQHVLCENLGLRAQAGQETILRTVERLIPARDQRAAMSLSGRQAVDGMGAMHVANRIVNQLEKGRETLG